MAVTQQINITTKDLYSLISHIINTTTMAVTKATYIEIACGLQEHGMKGASEKVLEWHDQDYQGEGSFSKSKIPF